MNDNEKLEMLKTLAGVEGDTQDSVLSVYLRLAGTKILSRAFPYDQTKTEVPAQYATLQCEIACYLYNRQGSEGQLSHSENGINRTYESADVPDSMLRAVTPFVGVM